MPDLFIDGEWRGALDERTREIHCPADGSPVGVVDEAGGKDTVEAIGAARRAFDTGPWPRTAPQERGDLLLRVAELLVRDKESIARAESLDTGKRLVESEYDVDDVANCFRYFGRLVASEAPGRVVDTGAAGIDSRVVYEPVGVCGLITPWNYPLLQTAWKVAPALAAGNTFVLKPSELTPHTAIHLMRLLDEAGLPAGVGNLVLGAGPEAGAPLGDHPDVDLVSFTGGLATGRRLMAAAAGTVKKVALELGGKNPNIVFADADFDTAVDMALTAVFLHSGQVCSAGARLLVEDSLHDRFVDEVVRRAAEIRLGGPFDERAQSGPLISAAHRSKVEAYVAKGIAEGAVLRCGGARPTGPGLDELLLPAHGAGRVRRRDVGGPGGVLRTGTHGGALHRRGRGRTPGERHRLRPRGRRMDARRGEGRARRGRAADRHGLDQRLPPLRPAGRVGRLQAVRNRARTGPLRTGRVPRGQAHLAQHQSHPAGMVQLIRG